jgi:hypothetical protein
LLACHIEQEQYNPDFVEQVAAMEDRAKKVGVEGALASQAAQELTLPRFESQNGELLPRQAQDKHKQKEMAVDFDVVLQQGS